MKRIVRLLGNRFVALPAAILIAAALWNGYVSMHNDGVLRGRVVGADGRPVAGATVQLLEQNFTTHSDRDRTHTGSDGSFEFRDNRSHHVLLRAEKPGVGRSEQREVRLWFRAQHRVIDRPLVLRPQG